MTSFYDTNDGDYQENRAWVRNTLGSAGFDDIERLNSECSGGLPEFADAALALANALNKDRHKAATDADIELLTRTKGGWARFVDPDLSNAREARIILWECSRHRLLVIKLDGQWKVRNANKPHLDPLDEWEDDNEEVPTSYEPDEFQLAAEADALPATPNLSDATLASAEMVGENLRIVSLSEQDEAGGPDVVSLEAELAELTTVVESRLERERLGRSERSRANEELERSLDELRSLRSENSELRSALGALAERHESLTRSLTNATRQLDDARREVLRLLALLRSEN